MKKKVGLFYKKNGSFNNAVLTVDKSIIEALNVSKEENEIVFSMENRIITLTKGRCEEELEEKDIHGNLLKYRKNVNINFSKVYKDKDYYVAKLNIPFGVVDTLKITKESNDVTVTIGDKFVTIDREERVGKVYTLKVNKGGIGKTFLTVQLAHGLTMKGSKVMILTSDSQNNIIDFTIPEDKQERVELKKGLRSWVMTGKGDKINLRKNLDFIPLESSVFTERFLEKLPLFIEHLKREYDYVLIDSIPTMKIDTEFVKCSDKIIIPAFCDIPTLKGVINVIEEAGVEKIQAILVNLYRATVTQKDILNKLKMMLEDTDVVFPEPIKETSIIESLVKKGKTVWESKSKSVEEAQNSLLDIIMEM